ncbi:galactokinase [Sulfobacillus thermosulfidooxidans]|uniref:galactokinase n=1 Tax=Sulfobacillus thermosulfidooxidans TaxID=28034 RepID=UPI0006B52039|nr:galactokinase family protein [Sulfobacillus thermosulfidooxidans]
MPVREKTFVNHFAQLFGESPQSVWESPGRVNLIGDHTDYQGGFALPIAVPYSTWIAARLRPDEEIHVYSDYLHDQRVDLSLNAVSQLAKNKPLSGLLGFVVGVWDLLGVNTGANILLMSTLPVASGLSSSASLSLALLAALSDLTEHPYDAKTLIRLARQVENVYLGVESGILDPLAIVRGQRDCAIFVDALAEEGQPVAFHYAQAGKLLFIIDTRTPRTLAGSGYHERVKETQRAQDILGIPCLRFASAHDIDQLTDPVLQARTRHIVRENQRVQSTIAAAERGDWNQVNQLLWDSHQSLSRDFMVSTPVLDETVAWLQDMGVGARMTGAGFGGSVVALGDSDQYTAIESVLTRRYREQRWTLPRVLTVPRPADGLHKVL